MEKSEHAWREYDHNEINHSRAHYLLAVDSLKVRGALPKAADLARELGVSRAAVSLQLKSLVAAKLLRLDPAHRLDLTKTGAGLVSRIKIKKEIFRFFLADVLGLPKDVAELDACKVEHLLSEETGVALLRLVRCFDRHPRFKKLLATEVHPGSDA
jgi:DtxR family Mn-dependent transcriptional regulator